jgi:23S rRNA maturation-related 3'-5' exoribonuclease YhaM
MDQQEAEQERIIELLIMTGRTGIEPLIEHLKLRGFFTAPASTKWHGCYKGGLAHHSLGVYNLVYRMNATYNLMCPEETMIIAALLHDVCKIGAYISPTGNPPYSFNRLQPKGHGVLSVTRLKEFISLTDLEEMMIKYHMGIYGSTAFEPDKGEYEIRGGGLANAWFHNPIVKVMYFCDELATLQEKAEEQND